MSCCKRNLSFPAIFLLLLGLTSCSSAPVYEVVYYEPAYRQSPPDPVYSRIMWSHLPEPIKPRTSDSAPLLLPEIFVELKNVTTDEAIEAVAQTMGYRWEQRSGSLNNRISIHMEGTVEEVLEEIRNQSKVNLTLDHNKRIIRLADRSTSPQLPARSTRKTN